MKLYLRGHDCRYGVEQMLFTLFPGQKPEYPAGEPDPSGSEPYVLTVLTSPGGVLTARAELWWNGQLYTAEEAASGKDHAEAWDAPSPRQLLRLALYQAGTQALGGDLPWGALTGVRPVKLPTRWMEEGASREAAEQRLTGLYHVRADRARLAMECTGASRDLRRNLTPGSVSLYIGIPFCPTRCAYCSFISADIARSMALMEPYLDGLCREIRWTGQLLREYGLSIHTAYMGGGTPTTLSQDQLDRVLCCLEAFLPMEQCTEFTVEAGRPDTITAEKLEVLRRHQVQRISINPQTMEDSVLRVIGRNHTSRQIEEAVDLARDHFRGLINMDLIAGLPTDTEDGFSRTLDRVFSLDPDHITVHTLAMKRGSRLTENREALCSPETVSRMLLSAEAGLRSRGYQPYYLYRQKYMSGSFENTGWCRPGTLCEYNILMMEELETVLSLGAGGITKLVHPLTGEIRRKNNPKYASEYLNSWEKIAGDKRDAVQFQAALLPQAEFPV